MAYISFQPKDYFKNKLYTGNGSTNAITGVGFRPDWLWLKDRSSGGGHILVDSVRGYNKSLSSENGNAEVTRTDIVTSLDSDGFTLGADSGNFVNVSGNNGVGWCWKAGTTSGIATNGSTTITPTAYSFDQSRGFSMVKFTGNGVDGAYLPHGLGKAPQLLFHKSTSLSESWQIYSEATGNQGRGWLNLTTAFQSSRGEWYSTTPDTVNMRLSNDSHINSSGATFISYFFTSIKGYSQIGSFTGTANAAGPFIYTGFKPAWVLLRNTSASESWQIYTWDMQPFNEFCTTDAARLKADAAEAASTKTAMDMLSNGFKMRTSGSDINGSGNKILYMAFAEHSLVASNGTPVTAS
mgnify:CR=1 FL=1|tara:strand:- start:57 stop:1112 length:1056 start_codon:yes stop_codon:yes gene_type:complete